MTQKPILALAMLAAVALTACSDDNNDVTAPGTTAQLRVVHASPDAPNVDVFVDNASVLANVAYKTASDYLPVPSGSRTHVYSPPADTPVGANTPLAVNCCV